MSRAQIEAWIEILIAELDRIDGDVDLEDGHDAEEAGRGWNSAGDRWVAGKGGLMRLEPAPVTPFAAMVRRAGR